MHLGLSGFGAGRVFSDPPSSSVEQKTKLVPFSLSFPVKLVFHEGFNAKQNPQQQKGANRTFYFVAATLAGVVI